MPYNSALFKSSLEQKIKEAAGRKPIEINKLAEEAGLNESTLYKMFKTGTARLDSLEKIASVLEIDTKYFLEDSQSVPSDGASEGSIYPYRTKPGAYFPGRKAQLYLSALPEKDAELYIPYYDVEITAGQIEQYFDDADELPEGYIYAPQYRNCIACNVKGDSMYDRIFPGSRLYVYHLKNKKYIDFGHIYLIVLDGYRLLKYIDPDPQDETRVILRSHNREQYKDWKVEKQDIMHLFLVKGYENQNAN